MHLLWRAFFRGWWGGLLGVTIVIAITEREGGNLDVDCAPGGLFQTELAPHVSPGNGYLDVTVVLKNGALWR